MSNTTSFGYPIPTVRKVSALRQRMIDDMTVRNFAPNTQESYLHQINLLARHFDESPEQIGPQEIREISDFTWPRTGMPPSVPGPWR